MLIKKYSGAQPQSMKHYVEDIIENDDVDGIIINTGLNSVGNKYTVQSEVQICSDIIEIVKKCHNGGITDVFVSSLTWKKRYTETINNINTILEENAALGNYTFINNSNILKEEHACYDNLHLNADGLRILSRNFTDAIINSA